MQSVLIVHSKSSLLSAKVIASSVNDSVYYCVDKPLESNYGKFLQLRQQYSNRKIIAVGGGSVIDIAKIIAFPKRCLAYPQTASGSCATSHAVLWGDKKVTFQTKLPINTSLILPFSLDKKTELYTRYDALSHAVDSLISVKANDESIEKSYKVINLLKKDYLDNHDLLEAGYLAGEAIEITGTNILHAISYPFTTLYKIPHGKSLSIIFWAIVNNFKSQLPELPKMEIESLNIKINCKKIAKEACSYPQIREARLKLKCEQIEKLLQGIAM
jgi:alcohol dehydrogenase class IV